MTQLHYLQKYRHLYIYVTFKLLVKDSRKIEFYQIEILCWRIW